MSTMTPEEEERFQDCQRRLHYSASLIATAVMNSFDLSQPWFYEHMQKMTEARDEIVRITQAARSRT